MALPHPFTAARSRPVAGSAPSGGDQSSDTGSMLADEPIAIVGVLVLWCSVGVLVAFVLSRRGHQARTIGTLGVVLGPLLIGLAFASLRWQAKVARPIVVRAPKDLGGHQRVIVAVIGDPRRVADALPVLRLTDTGIGQVEIAGTLTYEAARPDGDDPERDDAIRSLEEAAVFLDEYRPGLVLLPGRGVHAVTRFLEERQADVVLVVGDDGAQAELQRAAGHRSVAVMVGATPEEGR